MPEPMTAAELLTEGRVLLARPDGWCQGAFVVTNYVKPGTTGCHDQYCPIGAIQHIADRNPEAYPGYFDALRALRQALPDDGFADNGNEHRIIRWNDRPERTQAEVLGLYDRAIVLAGEEAA